MTRVMIVEDEYLVRVGLRTCINWAAHGLVLLDDAADGAEAYRQIVKNKPDILLLDLMLPKMDGFALMDKLAANGIRLNIIILTCCDDFESVRAALRRGVLDYINKLTMSPAELLRVFEKALAMPPAQYPEGLMDVRPAPDPSAVLAELIRRGQLPPGDLPAPLARGYCACLIATPPAGQAAPSAAIRQNMCVQILKNSGYTAGVCVDEADFLCIALPKDAPPEKVARLLKQHLEPTLDITCLIGFGPAYTGAEELAASYRTAGQVRDELFWGRTGAVQSYPAAPPPQQELAPIFAACRDALTRQLSAINPAACHESICTLFTQLQALPAISRDTCLQHLLPVLRHISRQQEGSGKADYDNHTALIACKNAREAQEILHSAVNSCFEASAFAGHYSPIVQKSIAFILANKSGTVRLDETAQAVNVSESYLSQLFKKDTGMNFVTFVQRYKISLAKTMLQNHMRVYEVCDAIGFDNPNYFAKIFKRFTGVAPAEYRKHSDPEV